MTAGTRVSLAGAAVLVAMLGLFAARPLLLDRAEYALVDWRFQQRGLLEPVGGVAVVAIDARSIDALGPIATVDVERWWNAVTVDLRGTMLCARAAMSLMLDRGSGRIVTVYGNLGDDGREHVSAFAAAKAGIARFTETLATELDGTGVYAMCVHPGFVRTPMTEHRASGVEGQQWLPDFGPRAAEHDCDQRHGRDHTQRLQRVDPQRLAEGGLLVDPAGCRAGIRGGFGGFVGVLLDHALL